MYKTNFLRIIDNDKREKNGRKNPSRVSFFLYVRVYVSVCLILDLRVPAFGATTSLHKQDERRREVLGLSFSLYFVCVCVYGMGFKESGRWPPGGGERVCVRDRKRRRRDGRATDNSHDNSTSRIFFFSSCSSSSSLFLLLFFPVMSLISVSFPSSHPPFLPRANHV